MGKNRSHQKSPPLKATMVILKAMVQMGFLAQEKDSLTANEGTQTLVLFEVLLSAKKLSPETEAAGPLSPQPQAQDATLQSSVPAHSLAFSSQSARTCQQSV